MKGTLYSLYDRGVKTGSRLVGFGDLNFHKAGPEASFGESECYLCVKGKGVVARMANATVGAIAGFGMAIIGSEAKVDKRRGSQVSYHQEWWFVPEGHDEPGSELPKA